MNVFCRGLQDAQAILGDHFGRPGLVEPQALIIEAMYTQRKGHGGQEER
jgi:hypothetical protein